VANGKSAPELMALAIEPKPALSATILSVTRTTDNKGFSKATALVEVTSGGAPIQGANVVSSYTGPTSGTAAGVTDAQGRVSLITTSKKNATGTWCFTLTSVTKSGYNPPATYPTLCESAKQSSLVEGETVKYSDDLLISPNPAVSNASLTYSVSEISRVSINIFDNSGRKIAKLAEGSHDPGIYMVDLDVSVLPEGLYFILMQTGKNQFTKKLVVAR
jgi:hypothetical protein